ncbi:MAG: hypothetical protein ACAH80_09740 [Alphaproteobacteria bacterium]
MTKSFSAKSLGLLCAGLLLLSAAAVDAAQKKNPVFDNRRTLFATIGQTTMVFEAPKGMCFMDESRVTENALLKSMKDAARHNGGMLVAVFADCKELAGIGVIDAGSSFVLKRKGTITWADATRPPPKKLTRQEFIDMHAPNFREDAWNDMLRAFTKQGRLKKRVEGALTTTTYMANPEDYNFDAKPHVTGDGVSLAYAVNSEVEYKKLTTGGVVGKTLIRHVPLEFQISMSGDRSEPDFTRFYKMMDSFIAQQVRLNH